MRLKSRIRRLLAAVDMLGGDVRVVKVSSWVMMGREGVWNKKVPCRELQAGFEVCVLKSRGSCAQGCEVEERAR